MSNFFGFFITIIFYKIAERLKWTKLPPIIIAGGAIILMLEVFKIDIKN